MSISSALGGNTGCRCAVSIMMPIQQLVILWVTLPAGWDTRPDWGHELVLDLLPGVLLEVCLDGARLRNLPLQFCAEENESHECGGANWAFSSSNSFWHMLLYLFQDTASCTSLLTFRGKKGPQITTIPHCPSHPCFPSWLLLWPPPKPGPCSIRPPSPLPPPGHSPCSVSCTRSSRALPSQSLVLAQVSAQGAEVRALLHSPPVASPMPPCSLYNQECKKGDWYRAAALEATLPVKVNPTSF